MTCDFKINNYTIRTFLQKRTMQQFLHSELSQVFVSTSRLASFIFILFFLSFTLSAKDSVFHEICYADKIHFDSKSSETLSENYFILEEIPGKYKVLKAVVNGKEIIMRPGRLEMFLNSTNTEESSFLIFDGSNVNAEPIGVNRISESKKEISNPAMADALNEKHIIVTVFEKVVYKDLYTGIDLELSIGENGVQSTLISSNKRQASEAFKMRLVSSAAQKNMGKSIHLGHAASQNSIEITSSQNDLKINNHNNIQFSANSNSIENLTFDIILK